METTDIEKKSLETHVELCAQRYKYLETRLAGLGEQIDDTNKVVTDVHSMVSKMAEKSNDRLINWGIGIIAFLVATVGYLLVHGGFIKS